MTRPLSRCGACHAGVVPRASGGVRESGLEARARGRRRPTRRAAAAGVRCSCIRGVQAAMERAGPSDGGAAANGRPESCCPPGGERGGSDSVGLALVLHQRPVQRPVHAARARYGRTRAVCMLSIMLVRESLEGRDWRPVCAALHCGRALPCLALRSLNMAHSYGPRHPRPGGAGAVSVQSV